MATLDNTDIHTITDPTATPGNPTPHGAVQMELYSKVEVDKLNAELTLHEADTTVHFVPPEKATLFTDITNIKNDITNLNTAITNINNTLTIINDPSTGWAAAIAAEAAARIAGDTALNTALSLKTDQADFLSHTGGLTGGASIHVTATDKATWNGKANAVDLAAEVARATSAEGSISSALSAHTSNTTIHVTASDKINWNNKADQSALDTEIAARAAGDAANATAINNEQIRAQAAESTLTANKMDKISGATGGEIVTSLATGNTEESGVKLSDLTKLTDLAAYMHLLTRPSTGGKIVISQPVTGEVQESSTAITDLATQLALAAEITRATTAETALDNAVKALQSLGHYLGSVATDTDIASFVLPAGATVNDFITVIKDNSGTHGGATWLYTLTSLGPPPVFAPDFPMGTDVTGKMSLIVSATGGMLVESLSSGEVRETALTTAGVAAVIAAFPAVQAGLAAEITRATNAEAAIAADLAQEVTDRTDADTDLQNQIDAINKGGNYQGYYANAAALPTFSTIQTMDWALVGDSGLGTVALYKATNTSGTISWAKDRKFPGIYQIIYMNGTLPTLTDAEIGAIVIKRPQGGNDVFNCKGNGEIWVWLGIASGWVKYGDLNMKTGGTLIGVYLPGTSVSALPSCVAGMTFMVYVGDFAIIQGDGLYQLTLAPNSWTKVIDLSASVPDQAHSAISISRAEVTSTAESAGSWALSFTNKDGTPLDVGCQIAVHLTAIRLNTTNGDTSATPVAEIKVDDIDISWVNSSAYDSTKDYQRITRKVGTGIPTGTVANVNSVASLPASAGIGNADVFAVRMRRNAASDGAVFITGSAVITNAAGVNISSKCVQGPESMSAWVKGAPVVCTTDVNQAASAQDGTFIGTVRWTDLGVANTAMYQMPTSNTGWSVATTAFPAGAKVGDTVMIEYNNNDDWANKMGIRQLFKLMAGSTGYFNPVPIEPGKAFEASPRSMNYGRVIGSFGAVSGLPSQSSASPIYTHDIAFVSSDPTYPYMMDIYEATASPTGGVTWNQRTPATVVKMYTPNATTLMVEFSRAPMPSISALALLIYDATTGATITPTAISQSGKVLTITVPSSANVGFTYLGY